MKLAHGLMLGAFLFLAGCSGEPAAKGPVMPPPGHDAAQTSAGHAAAGGTEAGGSAGEAAAATTEGAAGGDTSVGGLKPVAIESGVATLSPENTKIVFVGTHAPPKAPDPRTGIFSQFTGKAETDGKALKSLTIDIDTTSIATQFDKLTNHLKNADFFEVNEYPTARFVSTKITPGDSGTATVTGNLTLLAATKEVTFPASVNVTDQGLTLKAEFTIDRTEFGMNKLTEGVEKPVKITAIIGEKTEPLAPAGPPGGRK